MRNSISIVTVCYNCKEDLETTIKSVAAQTYKNIEYIIVDGASTDGTKELLEKYKTNIQICISEPDDGIYDAMNKGIAHSHGEWLLFMNAGDTFCDANVLQNIFNEPIPEEKKFIYSDYYFRHNNGNLEKKLTDRDMGIVHHQSAIYKRELHRIYGYYIVTHPYIISDLMFFLAVPAHLYYKTKYTIASVQDGGVSTGNWIRKQTRCIQYIYGVHSYSYIFRDYIKMQIGNILRKLHLRK